MALTPQQRQAALGLLSQLLVKRGVDEAAAMRVFNQEGASGGIGDGGHAFGPGQFNDAGGVWTGRYAGLSPEAKNAQAWSPQGLTELADRVAAVSSGQHGAQAVNSIVRRFERPADPNGEVARALGGSAPAFQSGVGAAPTMGSSSPSFGAAAAPDTRQAFAQSLLSAISPTGQLTNPSALIQALQARRGVVA